MLSRAFSKTVTNVRGAVPDSGEILYRIGEDFDAQNDTPSKVVVRTDLSTSNSTRRRLTSCSNCDTPTIAVGDGRDDIYTWWATGLSEENQDG
ncbi:MAG: hypothetical protein ABEN55_08410, partial [Bradymonadaceae bacterium]